MPLLQEEIRDETPEERTRRIRRETIVKCIGMFEANWGKRVNNTDALIRLWLHLLKEFDNDTVFAATYDICAAESTEWPPTVSKVRARCTDLSRGITREIGPAEAWMRCLDNISDKTIVLTDIEKTAFKTAGGKFAVQNSKNSTEERRYFMSLYRELIKKDQVEHRTMERVKKFAEKKQPPILPQTEETVVLETTSNEPVTNEQIAEMVGNIDW